VVIHKGQTIYQISPYHTFTSQPYRIHLIVVIAIIIIIIIIIINIIMV